jgi:hypothetical protein
MTVGLSTANTVNAWLNVFRGGGNGVTFTAPATVFLQWHTADPGASGTTAVAAMSTRQAVNLGAASGGSIALSNAPAGTGVSSETITHISLWSASSAGTFYGSLALTASKAIGSGDTLTLTSLSISISPLAA